MLPVIDGGGIGPWETSDNGSILMAPDDDGLPFLSRSREEQELERGRREGGRCARLLRLGKVPSAIEKSRGAVFLEFRAPSGRVLE